MVRIPGQGPYVPPPIPPKEAKPPASAGAEEETRPLSPKAPLPGEQIGKGPELDARAIAVRMAVLAAEAKEKELKFEEIIQRVIDETGMTNPQEALEEANRILQKEIEEVLEDIKSNKELMEEAEAWELFGRILEHELNQEQIENFLGLIKEHIKGL
jgi:hypothetical protein